MVTPILSVIIPCYNNGNLLIKLLKCIKEQSFDSWETIIIDDGSTDSTFNQVSSYISIDDRFILKARDTALKGAVACRNFGMKYAKGKYIIHFDADDLISKGCFMDRVNFMENNPDIDYASFPAKSFTDEENLPLYHSKAQSWGIKSNYPDLLEGFLRADYPFSTWNNIYKKSSIIGIEWDANIKIYTDFCFIIPCILSGLKHKFSNLKKIDYYYRVSYSNTNMCSSFVSDDKCKSTIKLFTTVLISLQNRKDYKIRKLQFLDFIILHFERLLFNGKRCHIDEYIDMISTFYGKSMATRFKTTYHLYRYSNSNKYVLYTLELVLLGYIRHFKRK